MCTWGVCITNSGDQMLGCQCVCSTVTNVVILSVVRSLHLSFVMWFCPELHRGKFTLGSSWSPEWRWPVKHLGHLELDGNSWAEPPLQGTGRRNHTRQDLLGTPIFMKILWNHTKQDLLGTHIFMCTGKRTERRLMGSVLWWFCEEVNGVWVYLDASEKGKEEKKSAQRPSWRLQWVLCKRAAFFSGSPGSSGFLSKAVRIPQSRGWDKGQVCPWRVSLGTSAEPSHIPLLSVRGGEVSWDVHWKPSPVPPIVTVLLGWVCPPLRALVFFLLQEASEVGVGIEEELCEP